MRACAPGLPSQARRQPQEASREDIAQVCVAADGRIKATFGDGAVLLLSAPGGMFAYVHAPGQITRQTCEFVISTFAPRLCAVLQFRNLHLDGVAWCRALDRLDGESKFSLRYPVSYVTWPASLQAAQSSGQLQVLEDGRVSLQSDDASARLVLQRSGLRFAVSYPLLLQQAGDGDGPLYHYRWHTQLFAAADYPPRWRHPLSLALQFLATADGPAVGCGDSAVLADCTNAGRVTGDRRAVGPCGDLCAREGAESPASDGQPGRVDGAQQPRATSSRAGAAPGGGAEGIAEGSGGCRGGAVPEECSLLGSAAQGALPDGQEAGSRAGAGCGDEVGDVPVLQRTTHLPAAVWSCGETPNFFAENSWWTDMSTEEWPKGDLIQMLWTRDMLAQYIPTMHEVHAWVCRDGSFLATRDGGEFVRHMRAPGLESLHRANALPVHAWTADAKERYPVGGLARKVLELRQHAESQLHPAQPAPAPGRGQTPGDADATARGAHGPAVLSCEVRATESIPGLGVFTAFEDGRVQVRFADRTIVHVDRWHECARVVERDGSTAQVLAAEPRTAASHVQAALEFAAWAAMSEDQRRRAGANASAVAATLGANKRLAVLCEYSLMRKRPPVVTGAPASVAGEGARGSGPWTPLLDVGADTGGVVQALDPISRGAIRSVRSPAGVSAASAPEGRVGDSGAALREHPPPAGVTSASGAEREAVVEQWLKQNAEVLRRLE